MTVDFGGSDTVTIVDELKFACNDPAARTIWAAGLSEEHACTVQPIRSGFDPAIYFKGYKVELEGIAGVLRALRWVKNSRFKVAAILPLPTCRNEPVTGRAHHILPRGDACPPVIQFDMSNDVGGVFPTDLGQFCWSINQVRDHDCYRLAGRHSVHIGALHDDDVHIVAIAI